MRTAKADKVRAFVKEGDFDSALRIAKTFRIFDTQEQKDAVVLAGEIKANENFYRQLGKDVELEYNKGVKVLQMLFGDRKFDRIEKMILDDLLIYKHYEHKSCIVPKSKQERYLREIEKYRADLHNKGDLEYEYIMVIKFIDWKINEDDLLETVYEDEDGRNWTLVLDEALQIELRQENFTSVYSFKEYPRTNINKDILIEEIEKNSWRKARAKDNPHSYTLRKNWNSTKISFEDFVQYVRENGERVVFWNKPYIILTIGKHRYWSMGSALNITILINRADVNEQIL